MARSELRTGSRGPEVKNLQERLTRLGHDCGGADGDFGEHTGKAVRAFQAALGLAADGVVGPKTWAAIEKAEQGDPPAKPAADAQPAEQPKPATSKGGPGGGKSGDKPPNGQPKGSGEAPAGKELRRGSKGPGVADLQHRLAKAGFSPGAADGDFGPATEHAIWAFQKANGMPPTGVPDPATLARLDAELAKSRPPPVHSGPATIRPPNSVFLRNPVWSQKSFKKGETAVMKVHAEGLAKKQVSFLVESLEPNGTWKELKTVPATVAGGIATASMPIVPGMGKRKVRFRAYVE